MLGKTVAKYNQLCTNKKHRIESTRRSMVYNLFLGFQFSIIFSNCWLLSTCCPGLYILFLTLDCHQLGSGHQLHCSICCMLTMICTNTKTQAWLFWTRSFMVWFWIRGGNHPPCLYSLSPCPGKVCRTRCWRRIIGCQALVSGRSWIGFGESQHSKKFWRQPARPAWFTSSEWPMSLVSYWFMLWYSCGPLCSGL